MLTGLINEPSYGSAIALCAAGWMTYQYYLFTVNKAKVASIPTIGGDGFISSYITGWKFIFYGHLMVQEGYEKYKGRAFKIPTLMTGNRWIIVVADKGMIEDIRKAPEDKLSFKEVGFELIQADYVFGSDKARVDPYHIEVVRGPMTRGFPSRFADIKEEIVESFAEHMPAKVDDWTEIPLSDALIPIVARTSNRLFVGLPLCRNAEFLRIQQNLTIHVVTVSNIINIVPKFLKSITGKLLSNFPREHRLMQKLLKGLVQERLDAEDERGRKYEGRPNDMISWLLDLVPPELRNLEDLCLRILSLNFAAIHTTSITMTNVLFDLASRQEYIAPLREEVESVIGEFGWSKESMGKLRKMDSFVKESSRLNGFSGLVVTRKATNDFTFSDGTTVPKGFRVAVAGQAIHEDQRNYKSAEAFDGFRFVELRDGGHEYDNLRHQMVSLDPSFLFFGHGRAACPGRFFAVNEVKAMLAHMLLNYDFKLPNDSTEVPAGIWIMSGRSPSMSAPILVRKRTSRVQ
ncbi:cytochrome P450 [Coprinopsis marcescibilis]|uniref:Cytochrome P450 n=1 Tax=Coprinopsis marcescibilis TaxID=230819 RepID=A0A5C3K9W2_COPMA|nr:cytochrome P450 [Coprinopsis marcescibilis]